MIRALQWCVTLGNFAVTNMSRFRIEPCQGHMERFQKTYGYLRRNLDAKIKFWTGVSPNEKFLR